MQTIARFAPTYAVGLALAACTACAAAQVPENAYIDMSTCRDVVVQIERDGAMEPIFGRACLRWDGRWILVDAGGTGANAQYVYSYWPWYEWGGPAVATGSFVFIDRFHRFHDFHRGDGFRPHRGMRPSSMIRGGHGGMGGGMRRR